MKKNEVEEIDSSTFNKKAIRNILILIVCGIITGLILSSIFVGEANQIILNDNPPDRPFKNPDVDYNPEPLTTEDIIFPSIGVVIVCVSVYLLFGIICTYLVIYLKTKSKYIFGLLFFFIPIFIQSIFSVNTLRSLYLTPAIPFTHIRRNIGFNFGGLGGIIVVVSVFEIIGLSILLYLSSE